MRHTVSALALASLTALTAFAEPPPPTPAPVATPEQDVVVEPLAEPRALVEAGDNTKATLMKAIGLYEARLPNGTLPTKARTDGYADLSRAWLRLGDLETTAPKKLAAYASGRAAAQNGLALDKNHADCVFWDAANLATTGRTNGIMNSLFMLGELRSSLQRALQIDPNHKYARQTLANVDHSVPGLVGGSNERAEKAYLELLKRDPDFTPAMVELARFYRDTGNTDAARRYATQVLTTKRSSVPDDWRKFNKHDAQAVLKGLSQ